MSDGPAQRCVRCGTGFTPRPELLARFPGWEPRECPACYRASRSSPGPSGGSPAGAPSRAGRDGAGSTKATRGGEQHLTVAQVLETYREGPDDGVFTDGSSIPNPGPGGWGAVYVRDGEIVDEAHGYEPRTTNNRMELRALQAALELVPEGTATRVHTDSNLAVRTMNEWAAGWAKRGWVRKTGPVENLDLVRPLFEAFRDRPELELVWIKAHVGNRWNEYADALATAWARDQL